MKQLCCGILLALAFGSHAQVSLEADSSYVQDGALVLRVVLTQTSADTLLLELDKRSSLQQLNHTQLSELIQSSAPQQGIVFYHQHNQVDDTVATCDAQHPLWQTLRLAPHQRHVLLFETRCLSDTVLTQLNSGHPLLYELYIRYRQSGAFFTVHTQRKQLKIKKPKY